MRSGFIAPSYKRKKKKKVLLRFFLSILLCIFVLSLNGCAIVNILFKLLPFAAAVLTEYSPPVQIENKQVLSVKALRYIEQRARETRILKNEYFIVVFDNEGTETAGCLLNIEKEDTAFLSSQDYFDMKNFSIEKRNPSSFTLSLTTKTFSRKWDVKVNDLRLTARLFD